MIPAEVIARKRDGGRLAAEELSRFFDAYMAGEVEDYQVSALLMAVFFRGLDEEELDALTRTMLESGATLDLAHLEGGRVDKHSTGGVGDKVSLALAPLAAELGVRVPMMSGRGLGHTGGTLDKLEAIPGFRTDVSLESFVAILEEVGCAMIGQTDAIAPLDRRLYALRDVTGTVQSIPLIAASIMSKKLAEDLTGLVLDVKVGEGAFIPEEPRALELARTMVGIGAARGVPTVALLTAMDRPLGRAVGNALETEEAIRCLQGRGPDDLREVVVALAAEMAVLGGAFRRTGEAREAAGRALDDGRALERFRALVEAQGGDGAVCDDPGGRMARAPERVTLEAAEAGRVLGVLPTLLGLGVVELGGGRKRLDDDVDPAVGFVLHAVPGDEVSPGDPLAEVHARDEGGVQAGLDVLREAYRIGEGEPGLRPLVSHRVDADGVSPWEGRAGTP